jgi:hypothetical protein
MPRKTVKPPTSFMSKDMETLTSHYGHPTRRLKLCRLRACGACCADGLTGARYWLWVRAKRQISSRPR